MTIEAAIYARLSGFGALTALVGTRIYPGVLPASVAVDVAAVSFQQVSNTSPAKFGGDSALTFARWQFDCWAGSYDSVRAVADALGGAAGALRRYSGTSAGVVIQDTRVINAGLDLYEPDTEQHHVAVDIEIVYEA